MSAVITAAAILKKAGADHVLPLTHPKALSGHRCPKHLKYGATFFSSQTVNFIPAQLDPGNQLRSGQNVLLKMSNK